MKCDIEIYQTPRGGWSLRNAGKGQRWPLSSFGPMDGFGTRKEAEQRKQDIITGKWQDTASRIPVGVKVL
jgi:hypothetical protein